MEQSSVAEVSQPATSAEHIIMQNYLQALQTERMLSQIVHDLRGPLTAAHMCAQRLTQPLEPVLAPHDVAHLAHKILDNIERADRLMRDVLEFQRVIRGDALYLRLAEMPLSKVLEQVMRDLDSHDAARVHLDVRQDVIGYFCRESLRRAVWHLVNNSLRYGDPQETVVVSLHRSNAGAHISIRDRGVGIPDTIMQIFAQPMDMPDALLAISRNMADEPKRHGLGIGLLLSRAYIAAHGGTLSISTRANFGSEINILLPIDARPFQADFQ